MLLFPNQMLARTVSCYSLPADQVLAAWQRFDCMKGLPLAVAGRDPSPNWAHLFISCDSDDEGVGRWIDGQSARRAIMRSHPNRLSHLSQFGPAAVPWAIWLGPTREATLTYPSRFSWEELWLTVGSCLFRLEIWFEYLWMLSVGNWSACLPGRVVTPITDLS